MKGNLDIMGISHQTEFHISRHTPMPFSDKRMKEEYRSFAMHDNDNDNDASAEGLNPFQVTSSPMSWGLSAPESANTLIGHLSSSGLEGHMDGNPIGTMHSMQFANDNPLGQDNQFVLKNPSKLKDVDHVQSMSPVGLSSDKIPSGNYSHYYEEYTTAISSAQGEQDQSWPSLGVSIAKGMGNLGACHDANCMEQLLVHCGSALENNDVTLAQQIMWVLNNIASAEGDPNQRVTSCFLRALVARAAKMGNTNIVPKGMGMDAVPPSAGVSSKKLSVIELAGFVDLTPWHRFGFSAANGAIAEAVEGQSAIHILDFGITHCMQWPTLIDALSKRPEGPPFIRLTVSCTRPPVPPLLDMSYQELGTRLSNFARSKNVPFEFRALIPQNPNEEFPNILDQLQPSLLDLREGEALVVNCQIRMHYIPDETAESASSNSSSSSSSSCQRDDFLRIIRSFEPTIVTLVDEDCNLTCASLVSRLKSAFNYLWIPFDALDTFLPRDSKQRQQYEGDVGYKIENIIAFEGHQRIERLESRAKWAQRMKKAHFQSIPFSEDTIAEVKAMLDEHAAGWGLKKEEDDLLLTWKGHNVVFATACVPAQL
ncbi:hypothetical protein SUGI_0528060 [Cryptomeria japonica]|uniref:scarecrow-like protein 32 n=1 Tax=Cryptomeria japonica TaxID=3369 RepID=UPI002408B7C0|nr:scarecrow-like protein 32 [Cryptomeria japonica]XP_057855534.1 scarecrow-like protein 32 [Cryptomeria japonica]XP_057855535.1 scarecrow-like protein 32 [Cryptomeria japonica]XP_057855536.1 scarecrow-like protein 32 [Cryptomeria japonica]GLJ26966.1 hypothetical protein SUGI_0528060 [Cryptomeria japonica]